MYVPNAMQIQQASLRYHIGIGERSMRLTPGLNARPERDRELTVLFIAAIIYE